MKSYSQNKQDILLRHNFFPNKNDGTFVDIGAHDGVSLSNSLLFEELGWTGICVEPIPSVFDKLKNSRKCKCIHGAISDKTDEYVEFCAIDGFAEMLSGIVDEYDERHKARILKESEENNCTRQKIKVPNYNFNDVVDFNHINLLDIDTEGNELNILKSIDYNKYTIDVILVENNFGENHISNFLSTKNFVYVATLDADQLFKRANL